MNSRNDILVITAAVVALLGLGFILGWNLSNHSWERKAVEAGHAEWHMEDHSKKWRWKSAD